MTACPDGWHLPSNAEWTALIDFAGGNDIAGKKLKATTGWNSNGNGTDDYGFSALPGGFGDSDGSFPSAGDFYIVGNYGTWWSASASGYSSYVYYLDIVYNSIEVGRGDYFKSFLRSVRCVKD
jgi:uncharacterized protein (TIGR02145 family)